MIESPYAKVFGVKVNQAKLVRYFYTQHKNHSQDLLICQPLQLPNSGQVPLCLSYSKSDIDELDKKGTLSYIMEHNREPFLTDMVVLPAARYNWYFRYVYIYFK